MFDFKVFFLKASLNLKKKYYYNINIIKRNLYLNR